MNQVTKRTSSIFRYLNTYSIQALAHIIVLLILLLPGGCGGETRGTSKFEISGIINSRVARDVSGLQVRVAGTDDTAFTNAQGEFVLLTDHSSEDIVLEIIGNGIDTSTSLEDIPATALSVRVEINIDEEGKATSSVTEINGESTNTNEGGEPIRGPTEVPPSETESTNTDTERTPTIPEVVDEVEPEIPTETPGETPETETPGLPTPETPEPVEPVDPSPPIETPETETPTTPVVETPPIGNPETPEVGLSAPDFGGISESGFRAFRLFGNKESGTGIILDNVEQVPVNAETTWEISLDSLPEGSSNLSLQAVDADGLRSGEVVVEVSNDSSVLIPQVGAVENLTLEGAPKEDFFSVYIPSIQDMAFDTVEKKIYFLNLFGAELLRANYDGSEVEVVKSFPETKEPIFNAFNFGARYQGIVDFDIDLVNRKLYWLIDDEDVQAHAGQALTIQRADLGNLDNPE